MNCDGVPLMRTCVTPGWEGASSTLWYADQEVFGAVDSNHQGAEEDDAGYGLTMTMGSMRSRTLGNVTLA